MPPSRPLKASPRKPVSEHVSVVPDSAGMDRDHVEPVVAPLPDLHKIFTHRSDESRSLCFTDRFLGQKIRRSASLDFHEYKQVVLQANEVDLTVVGLESACYHGEPDREQIGCRLILRRASECVSIIQR